MAYTTINKSTAHFNTKLYTGNASTQAITGVGFQPDLVWIKNRSTNNSHVWTDAVRGADKTIYSNATDAEDDSDSLYFLSNGFKVTTSSSDFLNNSSGGYFYMAFAEAPFKYANAR